MDNTSEGSLQTPDKDSIKIVLQSLIVIMLGWVGTTVVKLQVDNGVIQSQLVDIKKSLSDVPAMKDNITTNTYEVRQQRKELDELKKSLEDIKVIKNAR